MLTEHECHLSTLWLLEPHAAHPVGVSWRGDGEHLGWYVNLQEPFQRRGHALQTMDLVLDIVVSVDRSWRWKDEDEFETACVLGLIDDAPAHAVRAEGEHVMQRRETNAPPFSEPWPAWRPESSWAPPTFPPGWGRLEANQEGSRGLDKCLALKLLSTDRISSP